IYSPMVNPRTKQTLFPGFAPGSEQGWDVSTSIQPASLGTDEWKYVVFKDAKWDYKTMDFDKDIVLGDELDKGIGINAIDPNLKPFFAHGGKLIQYHGWADRLISPQNSIDYYQSVVKVLGGAKQVSDKYRLFMVPGMDHCAPGDGPSNFDALTALE